MRATVHYRDLNHLRQMTHKEHHQILTSGRLEVEGVSYQVTSTGTSFKVKQEDKLAKKDRFFSRLNHIFSTNSREQQITECLSKLASSGSQHKSGAGSAKVAAPLSEPAGRIDNVETWLTDSLNHSFDSLMVWAESIQPDHDLDAVYSIYQRLQEKKQPEPTDHALFFDKIKMMSRDKNLKMFPSSGKAVKTGEMTMEEFLIKRSYSAPLDYYHIYAKDSRAGIASIRSRLMLNLKPEYAEQALQWVGDMAQKKQMYLQGSKVMGPEYFGQINDSIVFYLKGYTAQAEDLIAEFRQAFPEDAYLEIPSFGAFKFDDGAWYAELVQGGDTSYGKSRRKPLQAASASTEGATLSDRVKEKLSKAGYDPNYPAFVLGSPGLAHLRQKYGLMTD